MNQFIKVTYTNGQKILLNLSNVEQFQPNGDNTRYFTVGESSAGDTGVILAETMEEIEELIRATTGTPIQNP